MKIKKLLPCLMALAAIPAFADASTAVAKKVGPVSYYGTLQTSGGKIIGEKNKEEAMLRGVSLFWSDATGQPYYDKTVISWAVDNLKIDVFRFAMGITYYDSDGGTKNKLSDGYSYSSAPGSLMTILDKMVEAAIENDVYIIVDWHSHRADSEQALASEFFKYAAQKYANVPNVIFEIFNEPVHQGWGTVQGYANAVVPGIRAASQNLILVGTPSWSQMTQYGGVNGTNVGYVLHFYAGTHSADQYGKRATQAKASGNAVFITEWGTVNADGAGSANNGATQEWITLMESNKISNCNWSLRQVGGNEDGKQETSAIFAGDDELTSRKALDAATFSASGKIVADYLKKYARNWPDLITTGKRTGSCAVPHITAGELDGQVTGKLAAGCTYESSNPSVVTVSGSNLTITGDGYSILTANDGTQTVVTIQGIPAQTVPNFKDLTCDYSGNCSTNRTLSYSGGPNKEWIVTVDPTTLEGSKFTLTSLDPSIVTVKTASCTSTSCSNAQKGKQVLMYEFKSYGTAKIVASAPATPGYKAVQDTVEVTFKKGANKMTNNFKDTKLAFGASADKLVPDTTMYHTKVTYTFNGQPTSKYVTKSGNALIAGNENAVVLVTANAPETENQVEFSKTITVIVGDSALAVNKTEIDGIVFTNPELPLNASIANSEMHINSNVAGDINVEVFSIMGKSVMSKVVKAGRSTANLSLKSIPTGSYLIVVRQGSSQLNLKWNKVK